ncbi:hypothetical protein [Streptomyces sp. NPDC051098]|uniref:hypothetical protein n=1 Tax=Streptomyces sp. NPDC051098 TaxID=3155411 RepID=UPI0034177897
MPDCAPFQLYVYDVAPGEEAAVLEVIAGVEDMEAEDPVAALGGSLLVRGMRYATDDAPFSTAQEVAADLTERAPTAVFELWLDPQHEYGGYYVAQVPDVGTYEGACDSLGAPYVSLLLLLDSAAAAPDGTTVRDWIQAEHAQAAFVLTALRPYQAGRPY